MKTKERFIELRASGYTLAQAAKELEISYNTAVNWEKQFKYHIDGLKAIKMEELAEKYLMTTIKKIEFFGEQLLSMQDEIAKRDLSEIPTLKLFELRDKCYDALNAETKRPSFLTKKEIKELEEDRATNEIERKEEKESDREQRRINRRLALF